MTTALPRILAIDDTPANLITLGGALVGEFELQFATSGPEGLALARECPPDLILLDVMMPEMDGYEVCRQLKQDSCLREIPVIFITALDSIESEISGLELGAVDYLNKPIHIGIARQRIRNQLEREHLRRQLEAERNLLEVRVAERTAELEALAGVRENALHAAEQLLSLRTEFIRRMSHELRTPLNQIIGLAGLCERATQNPEKLCSYSRMIADAGQQLLGVVVAVLDYAAARTGRLSVVRDPVDLTALLKTACELAGSRAAAKGLGFRNLCAPDLPACIEGDGLHLQQVLETLINNALKFTDQGWIELRVRADASTLDIVVADTGIGMTPEQLAAGFQPFEQAEIGNTRRFGGIGLSLALAEHLVALMGGQLLVDSTPGQGSVFTLTLPRVDCPATGAPAWM